MNFTVVFSVVQPLLQLLGFSRGITLQPLQDKAVLTLKEQLLHIPRRHGDTSCLDKITQNTMSVYVTFPFMSMSVVMQVKIELYQVYWIITRHTTAAVVTTSFARTCTATNF